MGRARLEHALILLVAVFCSALFGRAAAADPVQVRVRGSASIEAIAIAQPSGIEVRGRLEDDASQPIGNAHLRLRQLDESGMTRRLPEPKSCPPTALVHHALGFSEQADEYVIDTDGTGAFCVELVGAPAVGKVELTFRDERGFYSEAKTELDLEPVRRALTLTFSPVPGELPLDRAEHPVFVETRLDPTLGANEYFEPIELSLRFAEPGKSPLAVENLKVRPGESAQFLLSSKELGAPGPGTLSISFAGSSAIAPAFQEALVARTAVTQVKSAGPADGDDPDEGISIPVEVSSEIGAVNSGSVEARWGEQTVGITAVRRGRASILVRFRAPAGGTIPLRLRYVPANPWWKAGPPLEVSVAISPPSPWRGLPWMLGALGLSAWLLSAWRRPARREPRAAAQEPAGPAGHAQLDVLVVDKPGSGWRGQVTDAHDGTPIAGATLAIVVPSFVAADSAATTTTDEEGNFALDDPGLTGSVELLVRARLHSELRRPLPAAGQIAIQLVSRRRNLLSRLVAWTDKTGKPWQRKPEASPGHVATVAEKRRQSEVRDWARAVEHAAFGPMSPDDEMERDVVRREPRSNDQ